MFIVYGVSCPCMLWGRKKIKLKQIQCFSLATLSIFLRGLMSIIYWVSCPCMFWSRKKINLKNYMGFLVTLSILLRGFMFIVYGVSCLACCGVEKKSNLKTTALFFWGYFVHLIEIFHVYSLWGFMLWGRKKIKLKQIQCFSLATLSIYLRGLMSIIYWVSCPCMLWGRKKFKLKNYSLVFLGLLCPSY